MANPRKSIESGTVFGEWVVIEEVAPVGGRASFLCKCGGCGASKVVRGSRLRSGGSTRCQKCSGRAVGEMKRHGEATDSGPSVEYVAWQAMTSRCSPTGPHSSDYDDRGLSICEEWRGSGGFERFLTHVGRRPTDEHSIDRIENDKGYYPGNVRWATRRQQAQNRRTNVTLTIDGVTLCVAEWARRAGLHRNTVYARLSRGWAPERAVRV